MKEKNMVYYLKIAPFFIRFCKKICERRLFFSK